jgi:hypothetical protein
MQAIKLLFRVILIISSMWCGVSNLWGQTVEWTWARAAGGEHYDQGTQITATESGNIFATGMFRSSSISFDVFTLIRAGQRDLFLVRYDQSGQVFWAVSAGGSGFVWPRTMVHDAQGNVLLAGMFISSNLTFGSYTLVNKGEDDIFLVKYNEGGTVEWAVSAAGTGYDYAEEILTDEEGNIYMAGSFNGPNITFGDQTFEGYPGDFDAYLVKYTSSGNFLWGIIAGGDGDDRAYGLDIDNDGNIYITGMFHSQTMHIGSTTLTKKGFYDMFVAAFDNQGGVIWAKNAGETDYTYGKKIKVLNDHLYVAGEFNGASLQFNGFNLTNQGDYDLFLAKYDKAGQVQGAVSNGRSGTEMINDMTVIHGNQIVLTGGTYNDATESLDILLALYKEDMELSNQIMLGGSSDDEGFGVCARNNELYLTGRFASENIVFGEEELQNMGLDDVFIATTVMGNGVYEIRYNCFSLEIYPNPSSGITDIRYRIPIGNRQLAVGSQVELSIYNIQGQKIMTLIDEEQQQGEHIIQFDTSQIPAGIYFIRLHSDDAVMTRKLIVSN